jgi:hypothetical protein
MTDFLIRQARDARLPMPMRQQAAEMIAVIQHWPIIQAELQQPVAPTGRVPRSTRLMATERSHY